MPLPTQNRSVRAEQIVARCRELARCSEREGSTERLFLCPAMQRCHDKLRMWMETAGMTVRTDAVGNLRGLRFAEKKNAPRLLIASHLDTVPNAGAFDGVLGVVLGVALVEELGVRSLPFDIEVIGFSEEEGVRFGAPFLGSQALVGKLDAALLARQDANGVSVTEAIRGYGLDPARIGDAALTERPLGYLEVHIEQGPVLEAEGLPLGIVLSIAGQTRGEMVFRGAANHAGTTPMALRRDALVAAAEWLLAVEQYARGVDGLVATTGKITASPGVVNVIASEVRASLDLRHRDDTVRHSAAKAIAALAGEIGARRSVDAEWRPGSEQASVPMDSNLASLLEQAMRSVGAQSMKMVSGAGHDAMVVADTMPTALLFVRSPGGISHHPQESVLTTDVALALDVVVKFIESLASEVGGE